MGLEVCLGGFGVVYFGVEYVCVGVGVCFVVLDFVDCIG